MTCREFEKWCLGEIDDGQFRAHRSSCTECQRAFSSDQKIMSAAAKLNENLATPDMWPRIKRQISRSGADRPWYQKTILYLAAACLLLLVWFLLPAGNKTVPQQNISGQRILDRQALAKVQRLETSYLQALDELQIRAADKLQAKEDPLNDLYRQKLALIDHQITRCRAALKKNPANGHIRQYLLAALENKQQTLIEFMNSTGQ